LSEDAIKPWRHRSWTFPALPTLRPRLVEVWTSTPASSNGGA
jgi:hypothetical protein